MSEKKRVTLGITGSIAAYKACDIIRLFMEKGVAVSVVMTREAEKFITPLTLSSLTGEEVFRDYFQDDFGGWRMPHIALAKSSDAILIAPATANIIGKFAQGLADDLLTCVLLATRAPVFIAPAMNTQMYSHVFVQQNCVKLKNAGVFFIEPVEGNLACGDTGAGHIADPEDIVAAVLKKIGVI